MTQKLFTLIPLLIGFATAEAQDFRPAVAEALNRGEKKIVIPAGVYRLAPPAGQKTVWTIRKVAGVEIVADGVKLISTKLTRVVDLDECRDVTIRGLTVDYDPLPFTQGKVVEVAEDKSWIDVKLDAGYPRQPYARIDVVDAKTRTRKRGMPFLWGTKAEMRGEDVVRVSRKEIGNAAVVGDLASLSTGQAADGIPHAVSLSKCAQVSLKQVTVHSAAGMGILECDGDGGSSMVGCKVVPGPKPEGATEERLLSSSWDAIQSKTMRKGPLVEDVEIRDAGDDSWSVQSSDFLVVAKEGGTAVIAFRDEFCEGPLVGDRLAASLDSKSVVIRSRKRVELKAPFVSDEVAVKLKEAKPWSEWSVGKKAIAIEVDGAFPFEVGQAVYCPDRQGNGFVFRGNRIHSPGRVLVKAGEGLIEKNELVDTHSGVTVCPEVTGNGAVGIQKLVIRGNVFRGTGYFCPSWWNTQAGSISITMSGAGKTFRPAGTFREIAIENNRFEDINGPSIVVSSTDGLRVTGNTFHQVMKVKPNDSGGSYGVEGRSLIWLSECKNVQVSGNRVTEPGAFLKQVVSAAKVEEDLLDSVRKGVAMPSGWTSPGNP